MSLSREPVSVEAGRIVWRNGFVRAKGKEENCVAVASSDSE